MIGCMLIRTANPQDATAIAEIYNHYVAQTIITFEETPVEAREIETRISNVLGGGRPWLALEDGGRLCAYAYATSWRPRPAYRYTVETTVYVHKDLGRRGYGRAVYTRLLADLTAGGFHTAMGVIALPNAGSVGLHEALGFKKAAHFEQVGRKFERWIDVGFWQVQLQGA